MLKYLDGREAQNSTILANLTFNHSKLFKKVCNTISLILTYFGTIYTFNTFVIDGKLKYLGERKAQINSGKCKI